MHPAPMSARTPSASAARIRRGRFVTDMETTLQVDLCRIATNTGECESGVNARGHCRLGAQCGGRIQDGRFGAGAHEADAVPASRYPNQSGRGRQRRGVWFCAHPVGRLAASSPDLCRTDRRNGGFPAFAFTFAALMWVWGRHYYFFRYYDLEDITTIVLNTLLLFLVLFYVYPLKFLVSVFLVNIWINPLTGVGNHVGSAGGMQVMKEEDVRVLFIIFGAGIAAINFVFAAMLWNAYRLREVLGLSAFEIAYTRTTMVSQVLNTGVALLSMLVASVLTLGHSGWAGYVYLLLLPLVALWRRRRRSQKS